MLRILQDKKLKLVERKQFLEPVECQMEVVEAAAPASQVPIIFLYE